MFIKTVRIFSFIIFLEIFLRISGFVTLKIQDFNNNFNPNLESYRILCVGESITMVGGDKSYPNQLDEILNNQNLSFKFQIINKGISGYNSDQIMSSLDSYINEYKPNMVITMMGFNDAFFDPFNTQTNNRSVAFGHLDKVFNYFQITKLIKGVYKILDENFIDKLNKYKLKNVDASIKEKNHQKTIYDEILDYSHGPSNVDTAQAFQIGAMMILAKNYPAAEKIFKYLVETPEATIYKSKQTFYHYLAMILYEESKYKEAILALEHVPYRNWYDIPIVNSCSNPDVAEFAINSFKKLHQDFPGFIFYADMIYQCYEKANNHTEADKWKTYSDNIRNNQTYYKTKLNHLKFVEMLNQKHITPVIMQYPLRNLSPLKDFVQDESKVKNIVFIDNETVFKEAVKLKSYDAIFSDYIAGDFGHLTPLGSKILAENVAKTLIKKMNWK